MAKIDSYSLDASITDNDSVLGIDSASGATKRFTMLSMKTYIASVADITAVIAGTGLSGGATSGEATLAIDSSVVTLTGTQTLTNKTLTAPVISTISNTGTLTLPTSTDTLVGRATTDTLTNKTLTSPTLTSAVLNTAVSGSAILDEDNMASDSNTQLATQQSIKAFVEAQVTAEDLDITTDSGTIAIDLDSETLTIAGGTGIDTTGSSNTITVAIDSTVATLTGSQTLTNKTLTSPTINSPTITSVTATALNLTDSSIVFEGATADAHETTLTVTDPTADRTITLPNETGTLISSTGAATNAFSISIAAALG